MNQCPNNTSVTSVLQCDDLLTEILLRLPPKSVFKFKCVSRTWRRLISDPNFCHIFKSRNEGIFLPLWGFFQCTTLLRRTILKEHWAPQLSFLSTNKQGRFVKSHSFVKKLGFFIAGSPQGIILCGRHPATYYVCNPMTNQWLSLPKPSMQCGKLVVGFSCEEGSDNGMVRFSVIRANVGTRPDDRTLPIETFSSETGEWRESLLTSPSTFNLVPYSICNVIDGIIYWQALDGLVAAYDPRMKENRLWLIELPQAQVVAMGQSSDGLLQCAIDHALAFMVWVLRKKLSYYGFSETIPGSEWHHPIHVSYKRLNLISTPTFGPTFEGFPKLIAFHPQNSQLVYLRLGCKIFCYGLKSRRLKLVQYHGTACRSNDYKLFPYFQPSWPPSLPPLL